MRAIARRRRGATAVGYGLLVGLIAVAVIAALTAMGVNLAAVFGSAEDRLAVATGSEAGFTASIANISSVADPVVTVAITLSRATADAAPATLTVATVDGSAVAGTDYTALTQTLTFSGADREVQTVTIQGFRPAMFGGPERQLVLALQNPSANARLFQSGLPIVLPDTAPQPVLTFADSGPLSVTEGGSATLQLSLSPASAGPVTAQLALALDEAGGMLEGDLRLPAGPSVTFAPLQQSVTVTVEAPADADEEQDETATLSLTQISGAQPGATLSRAVTVPANGAPPALSLTQLPTVPVQEGATVELGVQLSGRTWRTVEAPVSVTPGAGASTGDFSVDGGAEQVLSFPPQETHRPLTVTVTADADREADETVQVALGAPQNATLDASAASGSFTIAGNGEAPVLTLTAPDVTALAEGGDAAASLRATLSHSSFEEAVLVLSLGGSAGRSDVTLTADPAAALSEGPQAGQIALRIAPGSLETALTVTAAEDSLFEGNETLTLTVLEATGVAALPAGGPFDLSIADNDAAPELTLSGGTSLTEGGSASLVLTASAASARDLSVPVTLSGAAADFPGAPASLLLPAGETSLTVDLTAAEADAVFAGARSATFTLGASGDGRYTLGSTASTVFTVSDSLDEPSIAFTTVPAASLGENAGTQEWTVALSHGSASTVRVAWQLVGDDSSAASPGSDVHPLPWAEPYALSGELVFAPGSGLTRTLRLEIVDDGTDEADEGFALVLSDPQEATLGSPSTSAHSIVDNDDAPVVRFIDTAPPATVAENGSAVTWRVGLSRASSRAVSVPYAVISAATAGTDYTLDKPSPLVFAAGTTEMTLVLTPRTDTVFEHTESVVVDLGTPDNATLSTDPAELRRTIGITDSTGTPQANLNVGPSTAMEAGGNIGIVVTLSRRAGHVTSVPLTIAGLPSGAYTLSAPLPVQIPAGETMVSFLLTAVDDGVYTGNKSGSITLEAGSDYTLPSNPIARTAAITITEASAAPTVSLSGGGSMVEGTARNLTVTLSAAAGRDTAIGYAVTGTPGDFTAASGSVTVPAGQTQATLALTGRAADAVYGGTRDSTVTLQAGTGYSLGTAAATVSVTDSLAMPTLIVTTSGSPVVAEGAGPVTYRVALSHAATTQVNAYWHLEARGSGTEAADPAADLTPTSGLAGISPGALEGALLIQAIDDAIAEQSEGFRLVLDTPTGATLGSPASRDLSIVDNDGTPTVGFSGNASPAPIAEAAGSTTFRIQQNRASSRDTTVQLAFGGGATRNADYATSPAGTSVTIPAGSTYVDLTVTATQDNIHEDNQAVTVTLQSVSSNAQLSGTAADLTRSVTITDDEAAPAVTVALTSTNNPAGGNTMSFQVTRTGTTEVASSVDWAIAHTDTVAGDFTGGTGGTVNFTAGGTVSQTIQVATAVPSGYRQRRGYAVNLSNPWRLTMGNPASAAATIAASGTAPNCNRIRLDGTGSGNGTYTIQPAGGTAVQVYCDMTTDGGGWTLVGRSTGQPTNPDGVFWGCAGDGTPSNFGWSSSTGSLGDTATPYSLNALGRGLRFNEVLFGSRSSGNNWGSYVYRQTFPGGFDTGNHTTAISWVGSPAAVAGGNTAFGMAAYVGESNRTDLFKWRDNTGPGFGLTSVGWMSCYGWYNQHMGEHIGPEHGGNINGAAGMVMVR